MIYCNDWSISEHNINDLRYSYGLTYIIFILFYFKLLMGKSPLTKKITIYKIIGKVKKKKKNSKNA